MENIYNNFITLFKDNSQEFIKFLLDKNVFNIGIGVLISSQLSILTTTITEVLISPITNILSGGKAKTVKEWKINILGLQLKVGLLFYNLLNLLIILIVIFYVWRVIDIKNYTFVNEIIKK